MQNDITLARAGDKNAFVRLMEQNKLSLYRAAKAILKNDDDAADAMQDTVLAAWQNINALKSDAHFKTWLTRICITKCYQILRQNKHIALSEFMLEESVAADNDGKVDVNTTLANLAENDRLLITLFYLEDFKTSEIAAMLHTTDGVIRTRLTRARQRFKQQYEKGGTDK